LFGRKGYLHDAKQYKVSFPIHRPTIRADWPREDDAHRDMVIKIRAML